jgi:hypothetical protein
MSSKAPWMGRGTKRMKDLSRKWKSWGALFAPVICIDLDDTSVFRYLS